MFGRTVLGTTGQGNIRVSSDGRPVYKQGGITIAWGTVTAVNADTVLPGELLTVLNGQKYLRYGQILCRITAASDTITVNAAGGTFTASVTNTATDPNFTQVGGTTPTTIGTTTTAALAWNISAANLLTAIRGLANVGNDDMGNPNVQVTGGVGGTNPLVLTFSRNLGTITVTTNPASLTGGAGTAAVTTAGGTAANPAGFFGPYDPAATDGRQNLNRGDCFVLDETTLQYQVQSPLLSGTTDHIGNVFDAGTVWKKRLLIAFATTSTAASLAAGPTEANFLTAFPLIQLTSDRGI